MVCIVLVTMVTICYMEHVHHHSLLIDALGGTSRVADLCRVSPQAVSKWRNEGIPPARLMYLELARPDVVARHTQQAA